MTTKVIQKNESIFPFFWDRISFNRGLYTFGNQNSSDAAFQMILPGLKFDIAIKGSNINALLVTCNQ